MLEEEAVAMEVDGASSSAAAPPPKPKWNLLELLLAPEGELLNERPVQMRKLCDVYEVAARRP